MTQLFPVNKTSYVSKYLERMQTHFMANPELYFDPTTGELFDTDPTNSSRIYLSVNPYMYPKYDCDDYIGYQHHNDFMNLEEIDKFWRT